MDKTETAERESTAPPPEEPRRFAWSAWWVPWLFGGIAAGIGAILIVPMLGGPEQPARTGPIELPTSVHQVEYEIRGAGKSPEISFVVDGVAETATVENASMPWRKTLSVRVGPGAGVVQVMATNSGKSDAIGCSIHVDGKLAHKASAPGEFSTVSCSALIQPAAG